MAAPTFDSLTGTYHDVTTDDSQKMANLGDVLTHEHDLETGRVTVYRLLWTQLSVEDRQKVKDLYQRYQDSIPSGVNVNIEIALSDKKPSPTIKPDPDGTDTPDED